MRISRACRDGRLERIAPGFYVPVRHHAVTVAERVRPLQHAYGSRWIAVLDTAAALHRLAIPWPTDTRVHLAGSPGTERIQRDGLRLHTWKLDRSEMTVVDGVHVTRLERTLVDLMCLRDRLSAISALDSALQQGRITFDDVRRLAGATRRRRGAARSREWWAEADALAESPLESRVRLLACDAGFPPDELQKRFEVPGATVFADFAWRQPNGRWLLGEADGRVHHEQPDAVLRDRWRANALVGLGNVDLVRFTWSDTTRPYRIGGTLAPLLKPRSWAG